MENMSRMLIKYFLVLLMIMHVSSAVSAKGDLPAHEDSPPSKESPLDPLKGKASQATSHFQKGLEFSQIGKVDLAIHEYSKALELDPNLSMAYVNLGMSYILKKEFEQAVDALQKAIMKDPELKIAHFNLWWAYRQQQKYDLGIEELKKIITIDPNEVDAYKNLGDTYLSDKKMIAEAIATYARGLEKNNKDVSLHQKIGKAYELNHEWEKSIKHLRQAIDLQINDPYNYLFLYVTLKRAGKDQEAKETISRALSMLDKKTPSSGSSPGFPEIRRILEYLHGTRSEKDLLSGKIPLFLCQASYYIGMNHVFKKEFKKAAQLFQKAIDTGVFFISEYEYARIELDRILQKK